MVDRVVGHQCLEQLRQRAPVLRDVKARVVTNVERRVVELSSELATEAALFAAVLVAVRARPSRSSRDRGRRCTTLRRGRGQQGGQLGATEGDVLPVVAQRHLDRKSVVARLEEVAGHRVQHALGAIGPLVHRACQRSCARPAAGASGSTAWASATPTSEMACTVRLVARMLSNTSLAITPRGTSTARASGAERLDHREHGDRLLRGGVVRLLDRGRSSSRWHRGRSRGDRAGVAWQNLGARFRSGATGGAYRTCARSEQRVRTLFGGQLLATLVARVWSILPRPARRRSARVLRGRGLERARARLPWHLATTSGRVSISWSCGATSSSSGARSTRCTGA